MLARSASELVRHQLQRFPAVALLGARQVGKTTLALQLAAEHAGSYEYIDLEHPQDAARLRDAAAYLAERQDSLVVVDEVQRMPELFPLLRSLIDRQRKPGRFLLLGSSSPAMVRQASESLAGRIACLDLFPLSVHETGLAAANKLWLRGGYPEAFLARTNADAFNWMTHHVRNVVERDLSMLGLNAPARNLRSLLSMLASVHGQVLNISMVAKSIGLSATTIHRYLEFFEQAYLIHLLPSFHTNARKRLTRAPKMYLLDSGMLHALSAIKELGVLRGHALLGNSWEGFVVQQVRGWIDDPARLHFYRTQDGSELDLVILKAGKPVASIEIKTTDAPVLSKGDHLAFEAVAAPINLIVTPGAIDHPYGDGVRVCSLATLWKHLKTVR